MNKKPKPSDEPEGKSFEHHLKQLEQIVQQLEAGQMELSDSLKVFESGLQHLRSCHQRLREAEERIALVVDVNADGTARLKDIDESGKPASDRTRASKRGGGKDTDQLF